jgi:[lysine-biosynthesis-protein LysW]--L-2-aminoadipate ligase
VHYRVHDARNLVLRADDHVSDWGVVLNRELALTRASYVARLLDQLQVPAINSMRAIDVCGDKYLTSLTLSHAKVTTPRARLAMGPKAALDTMDELCFPVVLKPLHGSWARLCVRLRDRESATAILEHREALPNPQQHVYYLQEYVDNIERDIRVIVVGNFVVGAMYRCSSDWRHNAALGAKGVAFEPADGLRSLALAAAEAVGGDVVGVDIVEDRDGAYHVLEVNHSVEFQEFEAATGIDVAAAIVDHALATAARS